MLFTILSFPVYPPTEGWHVSTHAQYSHIYMHCASVIVSVGITPSIHKSITEDIYIAGEGFALTPPASVLTFFHCFLFVCLFV